VFQFTFGYQLAALVPFLFIYTILFQKHFFFKIIAFLACLVFLYLGMQISAFVGFVCCVSVFMLLYYRHKAVVVLFLGVIAAITFYTAVLKDITDDTNNILTKNI